MIAIPRSAARASRFGLLSLDAFRADLVVTVWRRRGIRAEGRIQANVVQPCVVTLDPVPEVVDEKITLLFYPEDLSGPYRGGGRSRYRLLRRHSRRASRKPGA